MVVALRKLQEFNTRPIGPPLPAGPGPGGFVPTTKLDPSQVNDLREPTRIAAEQLRTLTADARAADVANRTANAFQTTELSQTRAATVERLNNLAAKYDAQNAELRGANSKLGIIAAKNPIHPVTVNTSIAITNSISATLLEQRIITARQAAVGASSATGAQTTIL
jgi:hypothetical protein